MSPNDFSGGGGGGKWEICLSSLAHRNRGHSCDLRLRCPSRPQKSQRFPRQEKAMLHCDLGVRWKVTSDLRFRVAISQPKTPSFCGISGDLAPSTRKSLAIAIVRFWCTKFSRDKKSQQEKQKQNESEMFSVKTENHNKHKKATTNKQQN